MQTQVMHKSPILAIEDVTHNVKRFVVQKPDGYQFKAGQATNISIDKNGWRDEEHPFTFTSLNLDENLEFTFKLYPEHSGMTEQMSRLKQGDTLILREPWGTITYQGPGTFIAGGAGVTPFVAILRQLEAVALNDGDAFEACHLLFSNKTARDIILEGEFTRMLGKRAVYTLTQERHDAYLHGRIDAEMIDRYGGRRDKPYYLCGPPGMVKHLTQVLSDMGVSEDNLVIER